MTKALCERLREGSYAAESEAPGADGLMRLAADEIERLQLRLGQMTVRPIAGQPCLVCGGYWVPMPGGSIYHECRVGGAADDPPATDSAPQSAP